MRKMMKIALLCLCVAAALLMTACGSGDLPFTAAEPGLSMDEALALEPEMVEADAEKLDWACPRSFAGCEGTLYFRFAEWENATRLQRIAWVASPTTAEAPAVFKQLVREVRAALGKPDRSKDGELYFWQGETEEVNCTLTELSGDRAGSCELVFNRQTGFNVLFPPELE